MDHVRTVLVPIYPLYPNITKKPLAWSVNGFGGPEVYRKLPRFTKLPVRDIVALIRPLGLGADLGDCLKVFEGVWILFKYFLEAFRGFVRLLEVSEGFGRFLEVFEGF